MAAGYRKVFMPLMAAAMIFIRAPAVEAAVPYGAASEAVSAEGSTLTYTAVSEGRAVDGAEITLYKAADTYRGNDGRIYCSIADIYQPVLEGKSADDISEHAREYAVQMAELGGTPYAAVTTDKYGQAVFKNLPEGCYLAVETKKAGTAASFGTFEPSVLFLPETDDEGHVNYNVDASVKVPPIKTHENTDTPKVTPKLEETKTSEETQKPGPGKTSVTPSVKPVKPEQTNPGRSNTVSNVHTSSRVYPDRSKSTSSRKPSDNKSWISRITSSVKTGDENEIFMLLGIMIASVSVMVLSFRRRSRL